MASHDVQQTWNIFSHGDTCEVHCAVPADYPVPRFILSGRWAYTMQHLGGGQFLLGFDGAIAGAMAQLNGFYMFTLFGTRAAVDLTSPQRNH